MKKETPSIIEEKINKRSQLMASIKSKNTKFEKNIFAILRKEGLKFRTHVKGLPGTPDIAIKNRRRAVFLDSDFWHGYGYPDWRNKKLNSFWKKKIERNIKRDKENTRDLKKIGWKVLRVWEHQINKKMTQTISKIKNFLTN